MRPQRDYGACLVPFFYSARKISETAPLNKDDLGVGVHTHRYTDTTSRVLNTGRKAIAQGFLRGSARLVHT